MQNIKRANTMSTITVELIITMKTKFTSSNAEKAKTSRPRPKSSTRRTLSLQTSARPKPSTRRALSLQPRRALSLQPRRALRRLKLVHPGPSNWRPIGFRALGADFGNFRSKLGGALDLKFSNFAGLWARMSGPERQLEAPERTRLNHQDASG